MAGISDLRFRTADSGSAILDFGFHIPQSAICNPQSAMDELYLLSRHNNLLAHFFSTMTVSLSTPP